MKGFKEMKKSKKLFTGIVAAAGAATLACAVGGTAALLPMREVIALTSSGVASSKNIGDLLVSGYDSTAGKVFNGESLSLLYDSILGVTGTGTYKKVEAAVQSGNITGTDLYSRNGNKDIVLTFGGKKWTITNVSKATNNTVAVTLWLAENTTTKYQWGATGVNVSSNNSSVAYPSNMYSSSMVRVKTLNAGGDTGTTAYGSGGSTAYTANNTAVGASVSQADRISNEWANFTLSSNLVGGASLTNYITTPQYITYQQDQNWVNQYFGSGNPYIIPNEAWGIPEPSTGAPGGPSRSNRWYNSGGVNTNYSASDAGALNKTGYDYWKYDYVWLPSLSETGYYNSSNNYATGEWGATSTQRQASDISWLRSGGINNTTNSYYLTATGDNSLATVGTPYCLRPALHLNLTSAALSAAVQDEEVPVPNSISGLTYSGSNLWATSLGTTATWLAAEYHFDPAKVKATKVEFAGVDGSGTAIPTVDVTATAVSALGALEIKNAGTYTVVFTLQDSNLKWRNVNKSTRDQTFTITVAQKGIGLGQQLTVDDYGAVTNNSLSFSPGDIHANDTGALTPVLGLKYRLSSASAGSETTTVPTTPGSYVAVAYITNTAQCNYKITGTNHTATFNRPKDRIAVPNLTAGSDTVQYDNTAQTFNLQNWDARIASAVPQKKNGSNWGNTSDASINTTTGVITATKAGEYRIELKLNATDYDWGNSTTLIDNGTVVKYVTFSITPKPLTLTLTNDNSASTPWTWGFGDSVTAKLTVTGILGSDNVSFSMFYYKATDNPSIKQGTSNGAPTGTGTDMEADLTFGSSVPTGGYYISAEMGAGVGDNDNYTLDLTGASMPQMFSVGAQLIDPSTLKWKISSDGGVNWQTLNDNDTVKYMYKSGTTTPVDYLVRIDDSVFGTTYACKVDTTMFTNGYQNNQQSALGTYTSTVALETTNSSTNFANGTNKAQVSIHWEIITGDIDYSTIVWEYKAMNETAWNDYNPSNPPQYKGVYIQVRIKETSLPAGVQYTSGFSLTTNQQRNIGTYTAQMTSSDLQCDPGFGTIDFTEPSMSLNWEITKKSIPAVWDKVNHVNPEPDGIDYKVPEIKDLAALGLSPNQIIYKYFDDNGNQVTLADIDLLAKQTNPTIANGGTLRFTVEASLDPSIAGNYMFGNGSSATITEPFVVGNGNFIASVNLPSDTEEFDGNGHFNNIVITNATDGTLLVLGQDYSIEYYAGNTADPANLLSGLPTNAGEYLIVIKMINGMDAMYTLSKDELHVKIDKKKIAVPTANDGVFNGADQNVESMLNGFDSALMGLSGDVSKRNVGEYNAVVILLDAQNYEWDIPAAAATGKTGISFRLAANAAAGEADLAWKITPFVITADMVNKSGKNGVELNLPEWAQALATGGTPTLGWTQNVYETSTSTSNINGEGFAFESGKDYFVSLTLNGEDATNFVFEDTQTTTSGRAEYKIAASGFSAAMTKALDFMKANWWWLLIILAGIILLILLIVLLKKRRKNKEAREEKKRLEEEKREEKERREEERRLERERREEEERRRRDEEERRRNTPMPIPMPMAQPQMAATAQPVPQPPVQAQPAPAPAPQPAPPAPPAQAQPKPQKPRKKPSPSGAYVQGYLPTSNGLMPVKIRMKQKGTDFPQAAMPMLPTNMPVPYTQPQYPMMGAPNMGYPPAYGGADNRSYEVRLAEERLKAAELRAAEDKARIAELNAAEDRLNARMAEERARLYEDRAVRSAEERAIRSDARRDQAGSGVGSTEMLSALLLAAVRGMATGANTPAYVPVPQQPVIQQPAQPQPILITSQQPAQAPAQQPVVPSGAVMTTTSTTTIDASNKHSHTSAPSYGYDDNYDYDVFERVDDKNN